MNGPGASRYTFGTGEEDAVRLQKIAEYFNPLAEEAIGRFKPDVVRIAVDVGCGPGFTTGMLDRAAGAEETCGLDESERFLDMARKRFPACRFLRHDVTRTPFPLRADLMYARFVLSHLEKPVAAVNDWCSQLAPGGVLLIEETEAVTSEYGLFQKYLETNEALIASAGARLFIGPVLGEGRYAARTLLNSVLTLPVSDRQAASWFLPNTRTVWRSSACVRQRLSKDEIDGISRSLEELSNSPSAQSRITWRMRRIVLQSM